MSGSSSLPSQNKTAPATFGPLPKEEPYARNCRQAPSLLVAARLRVFGFASSGARRSSLPDHDYFSLRVLKPEKVALRAGLGCSFAAGVADQRIGYAATS